MIKKRHPSLIIKIIYNKKFLVFIGFIIFIFLTYTLFINFKKSYQVNQEIQALEKNISLLTNKNKNLREAINFLNSDEYLEKQARLNLGLKKQGEKVVVIKKEDLNNIEKNYFKDKTNNKKKNISNYIKWLDYFFFN